MQMLLLEGDDMRTAGWLFFYRMEKPYIWKPGFEVRI